MGYATVCGVFWANDGSAAIAEQPVDFERLKQLLDEHAPTLELYARQWCDMPEDVVQEAFVRLVQQRSPPNAELPWLYRVVRNGAISAARTAQRRKRRESRVAGREPWFTASEDSALDARLATEALAELPLEQREIVVAHFWGGLTFEQIAAVAEVSSSTAHRRYEAALASLRERLGVTWLKKVSIKN